MTFELTPVQLLGLFVAFTFVAATVTAWFAFAFLAYGEIRAYRSQHPDPGSESMAVFWSRIRENLVWPSLLSLPVLAGLRLGAISIEPEGRFLVFVGLTIALALVYVSLSTTIPNLKEHRRLVGMRKAADLKRRSHSRAADPQSRDRQPSEPVPMPSTEASSAAVVPFDQPELRRA